ncbi:MAG: hypothetical protein OXM57_11060 [bacterium]|nr:hypothetical protein [bacterium]MDE0353216.1 hypothetical protein [bacterium]MDE0622204.1 hypothetical protein [Bryobacterales bacterium]
MLSSVDIEFARISDSDAGNHLRVQVLADSGGRPDTGVGAGLPLATLTNPSMQVSSTERTYRFAYAGDGPGFALAADTTYCVAALNSNRNLSGTNTLPGGWGIGDDSRHWAAMATSWGTHSEALKIGVNLGAAEPFVQFRTCAGTVSGHMCSTGWVTANYTRHDPLPTITLEEGGAVVTYQWRAVDPMGRSHFYVAGQVGEPRSHFGGLHRGRSPGPGPADVPHREPQPPPPGRTHRVRAAPVQRARWFLADRLRQHRRPAAGPPRRLSLREPGYV